MTTKEIYHHQVQAHYTLLCFGNNYPLGFLVRSRLCKSSHGLFGKQVGGAHLGNNRFVFSDASDHCISLPLS